MKKFLFLTAIFFAIGVGRILGQTELIVDGDFSTMNSAWITSGNFYYGQIYKKCPYRTRPCTGYAYLSTSTGKAGNNLSGDIKQTVTIPVNASSATLNFCYNGSGTENTSGNDVLQIGIALVNSPYTYLSLGSVSIAGNVSSRTLTYPITAPAFLTAGTKINIIFKGSTNALLPSKIRLGNVSFTYTPAEIVNKPANIPEKNVYLQDSLNSAIKLIREEKYDIEKLKFNNVYFQDSLNSAIKLIREEKSDIDKLMTKINAINFPETKKSNNLLQKTDNYVSFYWTPSNCNFGSKTTGELNAFELAYSIYPIHISNSLSLGFGADISYLDFNCHISNSNSTIIDTVKNSIDIDGDKYEKIITANGITEKISIQYLTLIPQISLRYKFHNGNTNPLCFLTLNQGMGFSDILSANYNATSGAMSYRGHYPQYGITIYDLPPYDFYPNQPSFSHTQNLSLKDISYSWYSSLTFSFNNDLFKRAHRPTPTAVVPAQEVTEKKQTCLSNLYYNIGLYYALWVNKLVK